MSKPGGPEIEAHVVGHPKSNKPEAKKGQLGACPFSLRVLMLLEEKAIPYTVFFVDKHNKPKWLTEVNPNGTLPVIKDLDTGEWFYDSDVISDYLEQKFAASDPEAPESYRKRLGLVEECPHPAPELMPKLMSYLKASGADDQPAKEALCSQLKMLEDTVHDRHPYVGGADVNAWDCAIAPRAYIARLACKHFKGWDLGEDYPHVKQYILRMTGRPSWRNAASWDDESIIEDLQDELGSSK